MWAWLRSPRGSTATTTAVVVVLLLYWFAPWSKPLPPLPGSTGGTPVPLVTSPGADGPPAVTGPAATGAQPAPPPPTAAAPSAPMASSSVPPSAAPPSPASSPPPTRPAATAEPSVPPAPVQADAARSTAPPDGSPRNPVLASREPPGADSGQPSRASEGTGGSTAPLASPGETGTGPGAASSTVRVPGVAASPTPAPSPDEPAFDVVRVEPSGAAVIAGRAKPGSTVKLMDGETVIGEATVDGAGQFALLPPDLAEGSHYLTLRGGSGDAPATASRGGVAVAVGRNGATKPVVAMLSPDGPARVLSDGGVLKAPVPGLASKAGPVSIQAVEAAAGGRFTASGVATPGSQSRLYLNGAFLADVTAGKDGRWAVRVEKGMRPGQYVVRADELASDGSGKVEHRAEVPFTYPAALASGSGKKLLMARSTPGEGSPPPAGGPARPVTVPVDATRTPGAGGTPASPKAGSSGGEGVAAASRPPASAAPATAGSVDRAAGEPAQPLVPAPGAAVHLPTPATGEADAVSGGAPARAPTAPGETPARPPGPASVAPPGALASAAPAVPAEDPVIATIVSDVRTATVVRGDSLWRMSRKLLGRGINYTQIYASNTGQIRDPDLIYPGQIFVVPQRPTR